MSAPISYASSEDGIELPVIDVTHPAFAVSLGADEQRERVERFLRERQPLARLPAPLRRLVLKLALRRSRLARGLLQADGSFLPGMSTYLLKLGPEQLPSAFAPIDRRIAESLPAFLVRVRLADMATLLADGIARRLDGNDRPIRFVDIAGGPAMDALNALLLLRRDRPRLLDGREIAVDVLDRDQAGPAFGARALSALQQEGAPLHGLAIAFRHLRYDWSRAEALEPVLAAARAAGAVVACSSEGGLFEYGSDEHIVANLSAIRAGAPPDSFVVGSMTRDDAPIRHLHAMRSGPATVMRPFSDHVLLTPRGPGAS